MASFHIHRVTPLCSSSERPVFGNCRVSFPSVPSDYAFLIGVHNNTAYSGHQFQGYRAKAGEESFDDAMIIFGSRSRN